MKLFFDQIKNYPIKIFIKEKKRKNERKQNIFI